MRILGGFLLVTVALAALGFDAWRELDRPLSLAAPVRVEVPRGESFDRALARWSEQGLLASDRQRLYLSLHARYSGAARAIKAGEYELRPGLRGRELVALLVSGEVILHELTLVEGWTFAQALDAVHADTALAHVPEAADAASVMAALGQPALHPEGRFRPDTYRYARGTPDLAFLRRAFVAQREALEAEWTARDTGLPYATEDEALTMASIVERETAAVVERPEIAGVFVRRLQKGMRLQTDPTVIYGLGAAYDGNIRKRDLLADTPYNTYTRRGLPPTPICLPSREALHAATHPAPGDALYFVARGDGTHQFSATLAAHEAAVRQFQLRRRRR